MPGWPPIAAFLTPPLPTSCNLLKCPLCIVMGSTKLSISMRTIEDDNATLTGAEYEKSGQWLACGLAKLVHGGSANSDYVRAALGGTITMIRAALRIL